MERPHDTSTSRRCGADERFHAISMGLVMMAGGVILLLHRRGVIDARAWWQWAPLLMLLPAIQAVVAGKGRGRGWVAAIAWTVGCVLSLLSAHGFHVLQGGTLFALLLVAGGVWLLWRPESREARR